jgi:soluble cytochrome b562
MTKKHAKVFGSALALVLVAGMVSLYAQEAKEAVAAKEDVKALADKAAKANWDDLSKAGQELAKKKKYELLDVMTSFKPRRPGGKVSGIGVGAKPGSVTPDGIEAQVINLSRRVVAANLKNDKDLIRMAEQTEAVASISTHMPNELARKNAANMKEWQKWSKDMYDHAQALRKALGAKNPAQVKAAAQKLNGTCNECHTKYRDS